MPAQNILRHEEVNVVRSVEVGRFVLVGIFVVVVPGTLVQIALGTVFCAGASQFRTPYFTCSHEANAPDPPCAQPF